MITDRDKVIISFLTQIPCYSNTIQLLFFPSQRAANYRLKYLKDYGYIKRSREHASKNYFYWAGKGKREPADKHKKHYDLIARAYIWIIKHKYNILNMEVQKQFGNIKPDLLLHIERDGIENILPVELERSNNIEKTIQKYEDSGYKKVLLFSKRIYNKEVNFITVINVNLKELE